MLQLEFPDLSHKQSYLEMISEWASFETVPTSPGKLFAGENFEDFLSIVEQDKTNNPDGVNSHLFFLVENERIFGAIQIRHTIDHPRLIEVGGHIGYGIRPSERGKGYATEMLRLALLKAKELGLEKALITCHDDNTASAKVIENNGGVFERYAYRDEKNIGDIGSLSKVLIYGYIYMYYSSTYGYSTLRTPEDVPKVGTSSH